MLRKLSLWEVIAMDKKRQKKSESEYEQVVKLISRNKCADGHEMLNWGFDWRKCRVKFRCPLVTGKVKSCPYDLQCNKSIYGKTVYLRLASDLRLLYSLTP